MAELTIEQQRAIALAKARVAAEETAAPPAPAPTVKGLAGFGETAGGAAVGNPMLKANNPKPESDVPYELGGLTSEMLGKTGLPPEVSAGAGTAVNFAGRVIPALLGGGLGRTAAPATERGAQWLMGNAIKPGKADLANGKAARAANTFLDEGQNASRGSLDNMQHTVTELNREVEQVIANSPASVRTDVAAQLRQVIDRFHNRPNVVEANQEIANVAQQFANHPLVGGRADIPVQVAHDLKRGYQASVGDRGYGELRTPTVEAEKAVARGMREAVSNAVPEVAPLNARESDLINAMNVARRGRVLTDANKNPLGLAMLTHNPESFVAHLLSGSAMAKSLLARLLHSGHEAIPTGVGAATGASLADLQR